MGAINISILQVRKPELRKVKKLAEGQQLARQQPRQLGYSTGAPGFCAVPPTATKALAPEGLQRGIAHTPRMPITPC